MADLRTLVRNEMERAGAPSYSFDDLGRRRDRKRRNQRIAAGVVGIAVFVAAVWIVTSVGSLDSSETSVVPGGDVTGPAETGPTQTGPTGPHDSGWDGAGLPPEGAVESTPVEGESVFTLTSTASSSRVFVYADGRVLSRSGADHGPFLERRLTPEGLELLKKGSLGPRVFPDFPDSVDPATEVPTDAWADVEARPYVAPRYAICARPTDLQLPEPAQALLQGKERTWEHGAGDMNNLVTVTCYVVTTDEARAVADVLERAGFDGAEGYIGDVEFSLPDAEGGLRFEAGPARLVQRSPDRPRPGPTETGPVETPLLIHGG
jgi:hypothetical protein